MKPPLSKAWFSSVWVPILMMGYIVCGTAGAQPETEREPDWDTLPALQMAEQALIDTLYYNFDPWFPRFKNRIRRLEAGPQTLANQLELMRFYFYLAALNGELTHVLAFTSTYQIEAIKQEFFLYSEKAKDLAEKILENPNLSKADRSDAYFFLGVSEGYMGLLEYGEGKLFAALIDGLSADNHLEDALQLDPAHADAHVGLGVYRYGNTRLGGLGNFIMQGGRDLRLVGLRHIETALEKKILSRPLALKTLIWFYISEQINPDNRDLKKENPLSPFHARQRVSRLMEEYERLYFREVPIPGFIGNKGLSMMKGIQFVIDRDYDRALEEFSKTLKISHHLIRVKKFSINPKYLDTVEAGIQFCKVMMMAEIPASRRSQSKVCALVRRQIQFVDEGGSMVEYQSSRIRGEIQDVFYERLVDLSAHLDC